jgi:outer membrane protein assembly factor BamB
MYKFFTMKQTHFLIVLFLMSIQISGQGIAQWRGPARDGIYNETGLMKKWPAEGPKLLWHYDLLGPGHGSAAVTNDVVYTSGTEGDQGFIIAFNNIGEVIWKKLYGEEWIESWPGVRSTPLIDHDRLYILSSFGKLYCLKTSDGSLIWTLDIIKDFNGRNIKWGYTENLAMEGDKLFITVGGEEANVVAINKLNGKLIWKNKGKGEKSAYCSPTIILHNNRKIFVTQTESSILGFDVESGQMLWSHDQPNQYSVHPNTPLYHDGQLYIVSGYGKGGVMLQLSADGSSVTELWRDEKLDNRFGGIVLIDGRIWGAGDLNRKWECLDWNTGNELFNSDFIKKGNIISADGMLYCYGEDGTIALVEPSPTEGFKVISTFSVPYGSEQHWAHLVIHNKRLYVRHGESLMVYDISK